MDMLILTPPEKGNIETLNSTGDPFRKIEPVTLEDGRLALNADLLDDCENGQTWKHYESTLKGFTREKIDRLPESRVS